MIEINYDPETGEISIVMPRDGIEDVKEIAGILLSLYAQYRGESASPHLFVVQGGASCE